MILDEIEQFHDTSQVYFEHEHFDQYESTKIGQLPPIVLYLKSISLMHWNISKLLTLLMTSLIRYVLTMLRVLMLLILATLLQLRPTSNSRPLFGWAPADTIKRTFEVTTHYTRGRVSDTIERHWRSRLPACNVKRCNETVATDTVLSDTPAVDSGVTCAQPFVRR
jgi:hypothetical protein